MGFGAVLSSIILVYATQPWSPDFTFDRILSGYTIWILSPFFLMGIPALILNFSKSSSKAYFIGSLIVTLIVLVSYIDAFFIHLDAQGALIFIFMPGYQIIGYIIVLIITFVIQFVKGKKD